VEYGIYSPQIVAPIAKSGLFENQSKASKWNSFPQTTAFN